MSLRIGALFAGYGGLDMAVMDTLDAELAWYAEFDKAPAKVMAHHHPNVPNLWDVTKVDWAAVEPVDIITGGSPCQDLSHAGKRRGMTDGTRSNLWAEMREAVAVHRPRLVVWENVRGAFSARADSGMEPCPRCVGGAHERGTVLRALGRVLGDLAELGYDARWYGLRAAAVGAAHGRARVFVIASPAEPAHVGHEWPRSSRVGRARFTNDHLGALSLLPTPVGSETNRTPEQYEAMQLRRGRSVGDVSSLAIAAQQLLPTPKAADYLGGSNSAGHQSMLSGTVRDASRSPNVWRQYAAAIRGAEISVGRPAPSPTEVGSKGQPRLSPVFVEWLMMLPAGHVTSPEIGLTRNEQLKALGNGVVPAQAAAALRAYIQDEKEAAA